MIGNGGLFAWLWLVDRFTFGWPRIRREFKARLDAAQLIHEMRKPRNQTITLDQSEYTAETGADLYVVTAMEWVEHDIDNRLDELGLEVVGEMPCIDAVYVKRRSPNDPSIAVLLENG